LGLKVALGVGLAVLGYWIAKRALDFDSGFGDGFSNGNRLRFWISYLGLLASGLIGACGFVLAVSSLA